MIKLVDARKVLYDKCVELFHDKKVAESIYMYLCDGIEECDAVEPERKKGEWINRSLNIVYPEWERYTCSACGKHAYRYDFCPNCGAYMKWRDLGDEECQKDMS